MSNARKQHPVIPVAMRVPFILVTLLFPLWGFANDITNPMVAAFKNILLLTNFESSLVQAAFYGGYALMAIPAAIFIKKFSYKSGILIGLALYSLGCLLFIPSGISLSFAPFLAAYLIMTCGLSFLETTANPYILSMGDPSTATRRLNLAQAFNPMGSIVGMFVASMFILINLDGTSESGRRALRAAADGTPVYSQLTSEAAATADHLAEMLADPKFSTTPRLLKKASEESATLANSLDLLANPQPTEAQQVAADLAAQPVPNKFAAAAQAVAVVLQFRDKAEPTAAEQRRESEFHGPDGLETALMLGREQTFLADDAEFTAATANLAIVAPVARQLADSLTALYQTRESPEPVAQMADQAAAIQTAAAAAKTTLEAIPTAEFSAYAKESNENFREIQKSDLSIVVGPYALMGGILVVVLALFAWFLPSDIASESDHRLHLAATFRRLIGNGHYVLGVVAQAFYVGAQIMCWTFIIQYAELELGISKATAQNCNILAMVIFVSSRFICTFLLHYIQAGALLALLAVGGLALTAGTIFIHGYGGLYCLIGVSACMSLMFPTIYGIALEGLGDDAKLGSAGLILAIGGGCLMPPLQAAIIDLPPINLGFMELASVRASFLLPALCFAVIAAYGIWVRSQGNRKPAPLDAPAISAP